jgi:hypothetical protein
MYGSSLQELHSRQQGVHDNIQKALGIHDDDLEKARQEGEASTKYPGYIWTKRDDGTFGWRKPKNEQGKTVRHGKGEYNKQKTEAQGGEIYIMPDEEKKRLESKYTIYDTLLPGAIRTSAENVGELSRRVKTLSGAPNSEKAKNEWQATFKETNAILAREKAKHSFLSSLSDKKEKRATQIVEDMWEQKYGLDDKAKAKEFVTAIETAMTEDVGAGMVKLTRGDKKFNLSINKTDKGYVLSIPGYGESIDERIVQATDKKGLAGKVKKYLDDKDSQIMSAKRDRA